VTEEEVRLLSEEETEKQEKKAAALSAVSAVKSALDLMEERLVADILDCLEHPVCEVEIHGDTLDELLDTLRAAGESLASRAKEHAKRRDTLAAESRKLERARCALALAQGFEGEKPTGRTQDSDDVMRKAVRLRKVIADATAKKQACDAAVLGLTGELRTLTDNRKNLQKEEKRLRETLARMLPEAVGADEFCTCIASQERTVRELQRTASTVEHRLSDNRDVQAHIAAQRAELIRARKEHAICRRLYDLVKGQTGNGRITLEQYMQAAGFDGIIKAANKRLLPMSGGQYELYRKEDAPGKKSNTFLDLEVLDNYTGHRRPVGNLSGGESFQASLALALGLSDTVSSNLGGIQMDALFVDEGFGTLDRKSMENAMDILLGLSGNKKLVGIISHREELMENIPQQIRVKKTREGSQISMETGL
jgi:exonuclease SbcC